MAENVEMKAGDTIFEIGSGIGPASILLAKKEPNIDHIYSVEKAPEQVQLAIRNVATHNLEKKEH